MTVRCGEVQGPVTESAVQGPVSECVVVRCRVPSASSRQITHAPCVTCCHSSPTSTIIVVQVAITGTTSPRSTPTLTYVQTVHTTSTGRLRTAVASSSQPARHHSMTTYSGANLLMFTDKLHSLLNSYILCASGVSAWQVN